MVGYSRKDFATVNEKLVIGEEEGEAGFRILGCSCRFVNNLDKEDIFHNI
jgi:hypothetical protein